MVFLADGGLSVWRLFLERCPEVVVERAGFAS